VMKEIDLLDEVKLSSEQMISLLAHLFSVPRQSIPLPEVAWSEFYRSINSLNDKEHMVWNPVSKTTQKWINMSALATAYSPNTGCIIS
jgi:hypothetical protein